MLCQLIGLICFIDFVTKLTLSLLYSLFSCTPNTFSGEADLNQYCLHVYTLFVYVPYMDGNNISSVFCYKLLSTILEISLFSPPTLGGGMVLLSL